MRRVLVLLSLLLIVGGPAYYYFVHRPSYRPPAEVAYVLPETVAVANAPSQVRVQVATASHGDRVEVLERTRNWARVRLPGGIVGWIEAADLLDAQAHERGVKLLQELETGQPQAAGRTARAASLRVEPARDVPALARLPANQSLEVFDREVVERPTPPATEARTGPARDVWYLVRTESQAGWVLGTLVVLDIPEVISHYAQGTNLVAWLVLNTVPDDEREVPQYLVADRVGMQEADFTRVRVLTWWAKRQQYATAYVESGLNGYFPIRTIESDQIPHFRLRLVDASGRRVQKVYRMFDTIVRPLGWVEGWESDAMPPTPLPRRGRRR